MMCSFAHLLSFCKAGKTKSPTPHNNKRFEKNSSAFDKGGGELVPAASKRSPSLNVPQTTQGALLVPPPLPAEERERVGPILHSATGNSGGNGSPEEPHVSHYSFPAPVENPSAMESPTMAQGLPQQQQVNRDLTSMLKPPSAVASPPSSKPETSASQPQKQPQV